MSPTKPLSKRQLGVTLIDALLACVVLALGTMAVLRLQSQWQLGADLARQRAEALRLAQEEIESLRGFALIDARAGSHAYADIADGTSVHEADAARGGNASFTLTRTTAALGSAAGRALTVAVDWADRSGAPQQLRLDTIVAAVDPVLGAALASRPGARTVLSARGRSPHIPVSAKDLGDGRSAFRPQAGTPTVVVMDNRGGAVLATCSADSALPTRSLRASDLVGCDNTLGVLLGGAVRFDAAPSPNPARANDVPLASTMSLALSGSVMKAPLCLSEARKTVAWTDDTGRHVDGVPIDATPAFVGASAWTDLAERFTAYHCVVYPNSGGAWSGRSLVVPSGWTIGNHAADHRVCRHTSDTDASGAVDGNIEHPPAYTNVTGSLSQQNFLVVAGSENCPAGRAVDVRGQATDVFADLGTATHQP